MTHRFALVTGASSGIGACFARALPTATSLLLTARNAEALTRMRDELAAPGRVVEVIAADLATDEGRSSVIAKAMALEIDLLINNAGVGPFGAVLENDPAFERATVELNVVAPVVLTRALLPGMLDRAAVSGRRAGLILLSSQLAFQPVPFVTTYGASKSFLLAYGEGLAAELKGRMADVLVLCPGATRTGFGRRAGFEYGSLPGAADPMDVARAGLSALGRRTVHVHGMAPRTVLAPLLWSRRKAAGGLGAMLTAFRRAQRPSRTR